MVESFAAAAMKAIDIAEMLEMSYFEFLKEVKNSKSVVFKHYKKGRIKLIYEMNLALINTAKMGSPQAISTINKKIDETHI
jgi:hypothetical protein